VTVRDLCLLVSASTVLATAGCALLGKNEPLTVSYYSPALVAEPAGASPPPAASPSPGAPLHLRVVDSGDHLGPLLVYRTSDVAYGFYETRRWTEEPSVYLRRLLERALFEEGGRRRAPPSRAPTLEVELTAFEEVTGEPPTARVALVVGLTDEEGQGLAQRTIEVTRVADGDDPEEVVTALALALREAVDEVVRVADAQGPATK
jgi:uncharacterized lipoprotein YmbA